METCIQCGGLIGEAGTLISGKVCMCRTNTFASDNVPIDQQYNCPPRSNEIVRIEQLIADNTRLRAERDSFKVIAEVATKTVKERSEEKTFGCGHTNHGSCSQCLGHVTNERNDLLRKLEELQKDYSEECLRSDNLEDLYIHQAAEVRSLEERLRRAEDIVRNFLLVHEEGYESNDFMCEQEKAWEGLETILPPVNDSALAIETPQAKEEK